MTRSNLIKIAMAVAVALTVLAADYARAEQCSLLSLNEDNGQNYKHRETVANQYYKTWTLFRNAQFSELENTLQKRYQQSLTSDGGDLLIERDIFNLVSGNLQAEDLLRMWIDQYPKSFFAQLSAGIYYANKAMAIRGTKYISETTQNQLDIMSQLDIKATGYLQKAMPLNPRSALPQAILLDIAGRENQAAGKTAEQWLEAANQVDPKNLTARIKATTFLSPRWGGSFELLDLMVQQARKSLSTQSMNYLAYQLALEKAFHEKVIVNNKPKAYQLYKFAKSICENSKKAQDGIISTYQPQNN